MLTRRALVRGGLAALLWPRRLWAQPLPPSNLQINQSGKMGRLFTCGFEENDLTATMWTAHTGTAGAIVTDQAHSGTYAFKPATGDANTVLQRNLSASVLSGDTWFRFYFRTSTGTAANQYIFVVRENGTGTNRARIILLSTEKLRIQNVGTGTTADTTDALALDTWYRIEVRIRVHATAGQIELRYFLGDSTTAIETISTADGALSDFFDVQIGKPGGDAGDRTNTLWFDDVAINSDGGTFQNSWPGPGSIALIEPASDTSITWEDDDLAAAATFANINELPGTPGDTAYNAEVVTLNSIDRFGVSGLPAGVPADADMVLLDAYARVGSTQTASTDGTLIVWDEGGTPTSGPTIEFGVSGWKILETNEHQVYDLGSRTKANVDAFSLGYENTTDVATRVRRVSTLWANVEWIAAAGGVVAGRAEVVGKLI